MNDEFPMYFGLNRLEGGRIDFGKLVLDHHAIGRELMSGLRSDKALRGNAFTPSYCHIFAFIFIVYEVISHNINRFCGVHFQSVIKTYFN